MGTVAWLEGTRPPPTLRGSFSVTRIYAFEVKPLAMSYILHSTSALRICGASN